ncbi:hypothetical protein BGZ76_010460 [Entomortierella beljakovae]|nr:hypothetical protein BGZ76_010460 [Entomortierella beljakovae]
MAKLRVSVGGSYTDLAVINCNDELHPLEFETSEFKGRAVVRIKDFDGITNDGSAPIYDSEYFKGRSRKFSFQIEGLFKHEWDGEQIYFGTDFDHKVELPHGFDVMLKVARFIDPVVKTATDLDKPWILSPLVSSINVITAWRPQDVILPSPPTTPRQSADMSYTYRRRLLSKLKLGRREDHPDGEEHQQLSPSDSTENLSASPQRESTEVFDETEMPLGPWRRDIYEDTSFFTNDKHITTTSQRRKHFQAEKERREFKFKTDLVYGFEFFSPHFDFNTFDIRLGLSMNIRKYLNNQPVRYTCRSLSGDVVFWVVQFELVD